MPDWSYRTLFQPLLLRLPVALARNIALGGIGMLAKLPGGGRVIDLMGHMTPDAALGFVKGGLTFPSRVGLGHLIDPTGNALAAMARFGFGCIEVGPLDVDADSDQLSGTFAVPQQRIVAKAVAVAACMSTLQRHLASRSEQGPPLLLRFSLNQADRAIDQLVRLMPDIEGVILQADTDDQVADLMLVQQVASGKPLIWRSCGEEALPVPVLEALALGQLQGILLEASTTDILVRRGSSIASDDGRGGLSYESRLIDLIRQVREQTGPEVLLLTRGHVIDPQDAFDLRDAGADLVLIDEGLVFSGPGLSKRINEAELAGIPAPPHACRSAARSGELGLDAAARGRPSRRRRTRPPHCADASDSSLR